MPMTRMARNAARPGNLAERLVPVAEGLREALLPLVDAVTGGILRPSRLTRELGIDKSLASRLIQSLRHEEPLEFLHRTPAPTGLRILVKAAREQSAPAGICARAEAAADAFQALIDSTPGGRSSLDGWISAHSAAARESSEHRAKQAIYRAMSYLIGCRCETLATSLVLQPSADGKAVDGFELHQRIGLRRLRPGAPVAIFSLVLDSPGTDAAGEPWLETLDGQRTEDPTQFLLSGYGKGPAPGVDMLRRGRHTIFSLAEEGLTLDIPVDMGSAFVLRNGWHLASEELQDESRAYLLNYPCRNLVRDVFIHEDLWNGANPELDLRLPNPSGTDPHRYEGHWGRVNTVDMNIPIAQLGRGLQHCAVKELPQYARLLEESFARAGWDPERFRGYRAQVLYPVPMITMTWWLRLPRA